MAGMREAVSRSFDLLGRSEFSFLGGRRERLVAWYPVFTGIINHIETRDSIRPGAAFRTFLEDGDGLYLADSRHRMVQLFPADGVLSIGVMHGSFDPFHLGHLLSGLDAVADGSCSFIVFMPNADNDAGGSSLKPNKSGHSWRMRTCFEGGVDDFFPAARLSSFGARGNAIEAYTRLIAENEDLIDALNTLELTVIIGSDIVFRENFVEWTNSHYQKIEASRPDRKVRINLRVVQRLDSASGIGPGDGSELDRIREITAKLDYPVQMAREVSCASSTAIKRDPGSEIWLYPRAFPLLEALLLYGPGRR